jgi:ATP-binding cassette subfamily F protein uup
VRLTASSGNASGRLVVEAKKISKSFGERAIVSILDLLMLRGDRLGIVGPNGAGKTTLIKMLTGAMEPDGGSVRLGTNLQVVTLDQSRQSLDPNTLLADVITAGRGQHEGFSVSAGTGADPGFGAVGRRTGAAYPGAGTGQAFEFPGAGRTHQ